MSKTEHSEIESEIGFLEELLVASESEQRSRPETEHGDYYDAVIEPAERRLAELKEKL